MATKKKKFSLFSDSTQAVAMITPMILGFAVFTYLPILYIVRFCVYNYDGYNNIKFIGMDNFVRIFQRDPSYWESLLNTVVLSIGKLLIEIPLALIFAVLLNKSLKGSSFFRVMIFLPTIISTAIVGLIFSLMFSAYRGVINTLLQNIGIIVNPIDWFGSKWSAMAVLGIASIWCYLGINVIFFLMALQSVPAELYECAKLDGASAPRTFFSITIPMIGPIFRIVLLNAIIGALKVNDLVLSSTNGQPGGKTEVVMTYVFKYFFGYSGRRVEVGYASAMAVVTGIFLGIITVIYLRFSSKMNAE